MELTYENSADKVRALLERAVENIEEETADLELRSMLRTEAMAAALTALAITYLYSG